MFPTITVYEYERGLRYTNGKFVKLLSAGIYYLWSRRITIVKVDLRPKFESILGQEILTSDNVTIKISVLSQYSVADPVLAINGIQNYLEALYSVTQIALREIVSNVTIDELLTKRNEISSQLKTKVSPKAAVFGVKIEDIGVKDIMFPGELKKIFAQVVSAQKEGQAILERTRGETAALRNLANASKVIEENPLLLQLRLLQSTGNTIVFGVPSGADLIRKSKTE